jgi:hypothetical protein
MVVSSQKRPYPQCYDKERPPVEMLPSIAAIDGGLPNGR